MLSFNGSYYSSLNTLPSTALQVLLEGPVAKALWRIENDQVLFFETAYFELMAQLRQLRVEVPMTFTMEQLTPAIETLVEKAPTAPAYLLQYNFYRQEAISPAKPMQEVDYTMTLTPLAHPLAAQPVQEQHIELYKDYFVGKDNSSSLLNAQERFAAWANIFAYENGYTDCLLLNTKKEILGSAKGNLYALIEGRIQTPMPTETVTHPLTSSFNEWLQKQSEFEFDTVAFSPFELQKAEELALLSLETGLQPVTQYRKTNYKARVLPSLFKAFLATL